MSKESIEKLKQKVKELKEASEKNDGAKDIEEGPKEKAEKEDDRKEGIADEKVAKIGELTDTLQRLQAEFENYRKYVEKTKIDFQKYASAELIKELLPILDSFELALRNTADKEKFIKGVELIYSQLYSLLEGEGLKQIQSEGKKFDPHLHEVLLKEKSDKEEDIILEELQKGYMLNDKVLRYAKVKVSKQ